MEDKKKYLNYLLQKEQWTATEKRWMLNYLDEEDKEALHQLAQEQFQNDLLLVEDIIEQQLSCSLSKHTVKEYLSLAMVSVKKYVVSGFF